MGKFRGIQFGGFKSQISDRVFCRKMSIKLILEKFSSSIEMVIE